MKVCRSSYQCSIMDAVIYQSALAAIAAENVDDAFALIFSWIEHLAKLELATNELRGLQILWDVHDTKNVYWRAIINIEPSFVDDVSIDIEKNNYTNMALNYTSILTTLLETVRQYSTATDVAATEYIGWKSNGITLTYHVIEQMIPRAVYIQAIAKQLELVSFIVNRTSDFVEEGIVRVIVRYLFQRDMV